MERYEDDSREVRRLLRVSCGTRVPQSPDPRRVDHTSKNGHETREHHFEQQRLLRSDRDVGAAVQERLDLAETGSARCDPQATAPSGAAPASRPIESETAVLPRPRTARPSGDTAQHCGYVDPSGTGSSSPTSVSH